MADIRGGNDNRMSDADQQGSLCGQDDITIKGEVWCGWLALLEKSAPFRKLHCTTNGLLHSPFNKNNGNTGFFGNGGGRHEFPLFHKDQKLDTETQAEARPAEPRPGLSCLLNLE